MTVFRCADANCIDISNANNKHKFLIVAFVQINQRLPDWRFFLGYIYKNKKRGASPVTRSTC